MLYIQLPYGYAENNKQVQFKLPTSYEKSFYLDKVPYPTKKDPATENDLINLIKNRDDLKKMAVSN